MSELTAIMPQAVPADLAFPDWLATLKTLAGTRRNIDWVIGDWLRIGQERFPEQIQMELLGGELGMSPKRLKRVVDTSAKFPAHARDETLSIEHHAHVADLPRPEQMDLLTKAKQEHWSDDDIRKQAISRKVASGLVETMPQADYEHHALMSMQHAYNRAPRRIRIEFIEAATEANGGEVDL